jgi:hypothetical protein
MNNTNCVILQIISAVYILPHSVGVDLKGGEIYGNRGDGNN